MKCSRCSQVATTKYKSKPLCADCMKKVRARQAQSHNQQKCTTCGQAAAHGGLLCSRCREAKEEACRIEYKYYDHMLIIKRSETLEGLRQATLDMFEYMHENN